MIELRGLSGLSAWLVYNKIVFSLLFVRRFNYAANEQSAMIVDLKHCDTLDEFKAIADALTPERFEVVNMSMGECVEHFKNANEDTKRAMLLEAISVTVLSDDESLRLLATHTDKNGINYTKVNVGNIPVAEIMPMMIDTLLACSDANADLALMTADDLDAMANFRVDVTTDANEILSTAPNAKTGSVIAMALKRIAGRLKSNDKA